MRGIGPMAPDEYARGMTETASPRPAVPPRPMHRRRAELPFRWPSPPLRIVLVEPEIPPNTGNIARLCAATGSALHLVEPLGFRLTDRHLRRAGLDYWPHVELHRHADFARFLEEVRPPRLFLFSTAGATAYTDAAFQPGDALVFGSESRGLPAALLEAHRDRVLGIPMQTRHVRSLNLADSAAIVLYEALRQINAAPVPGRNPS